MSNIIIIGAGVSGLSGAYTLRGRASSPIKIIEKEGSPGGLNKTLKTGEFLWDLGGHRFYTKNKKVQQLFEKTIGDDLIYIKRKSQILIEGKYLDYPMNITNILEVLGVFKCIKIISSFMFSFLRYTIFKLNEISLKDWVVRHFGKALYEIYFKSYSKKVWGIDCEQLSVDVAKKRMEGLSFLETVKNIITKKTKSKTLYDYFYYPRYGIGMFTDRLAKGWNTPNEIIFEAPVDKIYHENWHFSKVVAGYKNLEFDVLEIINTIHLDDFINLMEPKPPAEIFDCLSNLSYRSMKLIFIAFNKEAITNEHWIYCQDKDIPFARLHEPCNWSTEMAPPGKTSLVIEYFCDKGEKIWQCPDDQLFKITIDKLVKMGFVNYKDVLDYSVVSLEKCYPLYKIGYEKPLHKILNYLKAFDNYQGIGRNAAFNYLSSDYCIEMGINAALNILNKRYNNRNVSGNHIDVL